MASQNEYQKESVTDSILNFDSVNFKSVFFQNQNEDAIKEESFRSEKIANMKKNMKNAKKLPHIKNYTLNMNVYYILNFFFIINSKIAGRVVLNIWRIARFELKLTNYDIENVIFALFKKREPAFANWTLSNWYLINYLLINNTKRYNESLDSRPRVFRYFLKRNQYCEV